jgi:hypothetical protein
MQRALLQAKFKADVTVVVALGTYTAMIKMVLPVMAFEGFVFGDIVQSVTPPSEKNMQCSNLNQFVQSTSSLVAITSAILV